MNILFVHEVDWENKVVFDIHSLSELLASFGHKIFMIDFSTFTKGKKIENLISFKTELTFNGRARSDASITLIRPGLIKAPFLDRASAFVTHYWAIENVIKNSEIDAIVLYSVPTNGYQVIKLARKYKIPVIFRSIDILYHLVPSKLLSPATFFLETYVYKNSDKIMTLSPKLSEYVVRMKAKSENVDLLLFGVDLNKFNPYIDSEIVRENLGIAEDDLVVSFVGTLFDFSGIDVYLEQFPEVVKQVPNARLLIIGGGPLLEKLKKRAQKLGLSKNVIFTGFQPFDSVPKFINASDICINPFKLCGATREIIPGKILQYLACSKPVIATPLPGMTTQIKGPQHGIVYAPITEFAQNTVKLLNDKNLARSIGTKGYQYVLENHDEINLARKLERVLFEEVKKKKGICDDFGVIFDEVHVLHPSIMWLKNKLSP